MSLIESLLNENREFSKLKESIDIKRLNNKPLKVDYDEEARDKCFIYNNHKFCLGDLWSAAYDDVPEYIKGVTDENPHGSFPLYIELIDDDYGEPEYVNVYKIEIEDREI